MRDVFSAIGGFASPFGSRRGTLIPIVYLPFIPSGSTGLITADSLVFKSRLDVTAEGWAIVETEVLVAPTPADPDTPSISEGIVSGSAGFYRMTNSTTSAVVEVYIIPPFDLSDYGSPSDELVVEYLTFSSDGPDITLPASTQVMVATVGTLARTGATVTLTPTTWDTGSVTVARTKTVSGVTTTLTGTTFDVFAGESYYVTETASKAGFITSAPAQTATGTRPEATPVYVGGKTASFAGTVSDQTISLSGLTGGTDTSPQVGDFVVVSYATGATADRAIAMVSSGYTSLTKLYVNDNYDTNLLVAHKFMGGTPDADVVVSGTVDTGDAGAVTIQVFRSVDPSTPMSATPTTATSANKGRPTPPAILPTHSGALVVMIGASGGNPNSVFTSGLSNFITATRSDSRHVTIGAGTHNWISGTYTPVEWGGNVDPTTTFSVAAYTLALKPAP